jgi:hypothetical protein
MARGQEASAQPFGRWLHWEIAMTTRARVDKRAPYKTERQESTRKLSPVAVAAHADDVLSTADLCAFGTF